MARSTGQRIAALNFSLTADSEQLKKSLRTAQYLFKRHVREVNRQLRQMRQVSAIATAGVGAGFIAASRQVLQVADSLAKSARNAGVSTDAFQSLALVFELGGSSASNLQKGIQQAQRAYIEAEQGLTTYARAFDQANLPLEELRGLHPEELFRKMLQSIANIEDPVLKNSTAMQLFGRAGKDLGTVMDFVAGNQLQALEARMHRLGVIMQGDLLTASETVNDNFHLLGKSIQANLLRGLDKALAKFQDIDAVIIGVGKAVGGFAHAMVNAFGFLYEHAALIARLTTVYLTFKAAAFGSAVLAAIGTGAVALYGLAAAYTATGLAGLKAAAGQALAMAIPYAIGAAVVTGIGALAVAIRAISAAWDSTAQAMQLIGKKMAVAFEQLGVSFSSLWPGMKLAAMSGARAIVDGVNKILGGIVDRINSFGGFFNSALEFLGLDFRFGTLGKFEFDTSGIQAGQEAARQELAKLDARQSALILQQKALSSEVVQLLQKAGGEFTGKAWEDLKSIFEGVSGGLGFLYKLMADPAAALSGLTQAGPASAPGQTAPGQQLQSPETAGAIQNETKRLVEGITDSVSSSLAQFNFKGVAKSFTDSLQNAFETALSKRISAALQPVFDNLFGGFFSALQAGGPGRSAADPFGFSSGRVSSSITGSGVQVPGLKFHSGGLVPGMKGREVPALLQAGEYVLPIDAVDKMAKGGPQQVFNYSPHIQGDITAAVERALVDKARTILQVMKQAEAEYA